MFLDLIGASTTSILTAEAEQASEIVRAGRPEPSERASTRR